MTHLRVFHSYDIVQQRRTALLNAIHLDDLRDMRRKVTGEIRFISRSDLHSAILLHWDDYRDEFRRWCEFAITGESQA